MLSSAVVELRKNLEKKKLLQNFIFKGTDLVYE